MKATILLLSVDEAPMLGYSLPAAMAQGGASVLVVDNASSDGTRALAERHGARLISLAQRRSYAAAINEGLGSVDGDAVLLLNADCFLQPGFLAAALARLAADPGVGSVAPKLLRICGPGELSEPAEIDTVGMVLTRWRKNGLAGHARPAARFAEPGEAFGADGAAALYRRRTLEDCALNGREVLDEDMELWASDADLAWRAQLLGWRCVYEPRAVAHHLRTYSPSTRAQMSEQARRMQFRNRYLMMAKNETARGLARDLPLLLGYEALALGHAVLRERFLLAGYREAWRLRAGARRRRALIQARVKVAVPPFGLRVRE